MLGTGIEPVWSKTPRDFRGNFYRNSRFVPL
jgi:hypothetical protein